MKIYSVTERQKKNSIITEEDFETDYLESVNNPKKFWKEKAESTLDWFSNWDEVVSSNLEEGKVEWFKNGKLNGLWYFYEKNGELRFLDNFENGEKID